MAQHVHDHCTRPQGGAACTSGILTSYCDVPDCGNEYCSPAGHCDCNCHSGRVCGCGHVWPRMEKQVKATETEYGELDPEDFASEIKDSLLNSVARPGGRIGVMLPEHEGLLRAYLTGRGWLSSAGYLTRKGAAEARRVQTEEWGQ